MARCRELVDDGTGDGSAATTDGVRSGSGYSSESENSGNESGSSNDDSSFSNDYSTDPDEGPLAESLFDSFSSADSTAVWDHMHAKFGLDLNAVKKRLWEEKRASFDAIKRMSLVNYVRRQTQLNTSFLAHFSESANAVEWILSAVELWDRQEHCVPFKADDKLLWELPAGYRDADDVDDFEKSVTAEPSAGPPEESEDNLHEQVCLLKAEISTLRRKLNITVAGSSELQKNPLLNESRCDSKPRHFHGDDRDYFASYSYKDIHREMILDESRTSAYQQFILGAADSFKGKVVLDVGCGSGILSMFCAQAGARLVVGIDAAVETCDLARKIVAANGFAEKQVQLISGKLEDLDLHFESIEHLRVISTPRGTEPPPPGSVPFQCDIIVSEWMGYMLLYESMLYTVLQARDRYLVDGPSGLMVPSTAEMTVQAADMSEVLRPKLSVWEKPLYGLDLALLKPDETAYRKNLEVLHVKKEALRSDEHTFLSLDLAKVAPEFLSARSPFTLNTAAGAAVTSLVYAFRCRFEIPGRPECSVVLETSPHYPLTHWCHAVSHLSVWRQLSELKERPLTLSGHISINRSQTNSRHLDVLLELAVADAKEGGSSSSSNSRLPRIVDQFTMA